MNCWDTSRGHRETISSLVLTCVSVCSTYQLMVEHRKCKKCGREKPLVDFDFSFKAKGWRRHECRACHRARMNAWHLAHKDEAKQRAAAWYKDNPSQMWPEEKKEKARANSRRYRQEWLEVVIENYGAKCVCCGETNRGFLTIDHINNDGSDLRKTHGAGLTLYRWIIKNNYPEFFQILCYNCNFGRQRNGGHCPHQVKKGSSTIAQASTPQAGWKRPGRPKLSRPS